MIKEDPIETEIMRMNDREMEARAKGFCFASGRKFGKTEEQKRTNAQELLIRRHNLLCECGHMNGRHWYAVENGTASHDCRDCDCLNFILQKKEGK